MPLHGRLARLIAAHGPISIADYMASANAHYYATRDPLGAAGDFTTAPEISQMFGELVGLALADLWNRAGRPDAAYVELGPGRGTLARDAMAAMARAGFTPPVHLVETSPVLIAKQAALLPQATHQNSIDTLPTDQPLLIVANEFFDALPIRQLIRTDAGWRELMVGLSDIECAPAQAGAVAGEHGTGGQSSGLRRSTGDLKDSTASLNLVAGLTPLDELVPPMLRNSPVGSIHEICPAALAIVDDLAARIAQQGGAMLIIDYGYSGPAIGDTLQAVRSHAFADLLADAGEADLTAHVDFTALAAATPQLSAAGPVAQGDWLVALGIDARTAALTARHPQRASALKGQRDRLVKADDMGQLFRVLALHHPDWPIPAGFAA